MTRPAAGCCIELPMNKPEVEIFRFHSRTLRDFAAEILLRFGLPDSHARVVGDSLVASNLRGVDSHGLLLLAGYIQRLRAGGIDGKATGKVAFESGACLLYDGQNGLGQVVAERCADHAVRLAAASSLGMVVARNSNHFGAAAFWSERMARAGCIGITMSSAGIVVPPWQGKSPRIGTNPIAMAAPESGAGRWLLDMATTTVANGRIANAADYHRMAIPAEWRFVDRDARPTTDRREAERGWPEPVGGYKGSGLAMMAEILCAVLSGGPMSTETVVDPKGAVPIRISHTFLAIDPKRFLAPGEFESRMARLVSMIKSSEPAPGYDEVLVAGEPEWREEAVRSREGIPIPAPLWERLSAIAGQVQVVPPQPDATAR